MLKRNLLKQLIKSKLFWKFYMIQAIIQNQFLISSSGNSLVSLHHNIEQIILVIRIERKSVLNHESGRFN